jgi:Flp pilus assembly protein TadG
VRTRNLNGVRWGPDRESGQATVEFALILIPLLILVVGVIQFGIALNFWLDEQRIANQGARFAVVNSWPGCPRAEPVPLTGANCTGTSTLQAYLGKQALSQGLKGSMSVDICYPDDGDATTAIGTVGTPVRVSLEAPYNFRAVMRLGTLTLNGRATMRLEQDATHLTGVAGCTS